MASSEFSLNDLVPYNSQEKSADVALQSEIARPLESAWLVYLNASTAKIVLLDFLVNLPNIEVLILQNNLIESLEYIWLCKNLFHLDVSFNKIKSIESIGRFAAMGLVNLSHNRVSWTELERIQHLQIIDLHLSNNNELEKDIAHYRLHIVDCLPHIWSLDGKMITALERARVKNFFQSSELSLKPLRHKLSGLVFKQTNSHHGEVLSNRATHFLRRFNVTVSHTAQLDEQRLLFAADQFCEDLATLNTPTWTSLPPVPPVLISCPKLIADAIILAKMDMAFGVDLISSLVTSLLFDIPTELVDYVVALPKNYGVVNDNITSVTDFFTIPGTLRLRLACFLLTRLELDFADHDRSHAVLEVAHDSAFFAVTGHVLMSFLKSAPTDPKLIVADKESPLPKPLSAGMRQCSTLFAARTLFRFLKSIFSNHDEHDEAFTNTVIKVASLLSSELMGPLVSLVKNDEVFRSVNMIDHVLSPSQTEMKFFGLSALKRDDTVKPPATAGDRPPSPADQSAVATLARELHNLYSELIDRLPFLYDSAANAVSLSASKLGSVGARSTPIGTSQALLPRPPPTPLRSRDALKAGKHVPPSGPPALKPRPAAKRPRIGDVVLVAIQHTGRIIAVPDQFTVCVQLDVVPDKVGLHPPGSRLFRPQMAGLGSSLVKKAPATLSSEYSYMYFNVVDLKWDNTNGIWRSHISNAPAAGRLYLNRATALSPAPESQTQPRKLGTPSVGTSLTLLSAATANKMEDILQAPLNNDDTELPLPEDMSNFEPALSNGHTASPSPAISPPVESSIYEHSSPSVYLRRDNILAALKQERAVSSRRSSVPSVLNILDDINTKQSPNLTSVLGGRVIRSAGSLSKRSLFGSRLKSRQAFRYDADWQNCLNFKDFYNISLEFHYNSIRSAEARTSSVTFFKEP